MKTEETTAIALRVEADPAIVLVNRTQRDEFFAHIKAEVEAFQPNLKTETGRKEIASLAYKVTRTKTAIDAAGKKLNEEARSRIALVDKERRETWEELEKLAVQARKPLTDWEVLEEDRKKRAATVLSDLNNAPVLSLDATSAVAIQRFDALTDYMLSEEDLKEFFAQAVALKNAGLVSLIASVARLEKAEADAAELARLREAEAQREAEDRRLAAEAEQVRIAAAQAEAARLAEEARIEGERQAEQRRQELEAERTAQAVKDAQDKAAREAQERLEAANREAERLNREAAAKIEAEHQKELAVERSKTAAAEKARADELAAQQAAARKAEAEKAAADKLAANKKHRTKIVEAAAQAISLEGGFDVARARTVVDAIVNGKIPNVGVTF